MARRNQSTDSASGRSRGARTTSGARPRSGERRDGQAARSVRANPVSATGTCRISGGTQEQDLGVWILRRIEPRCVELAMGYARNCADVHVGKLLLGKCDNAFNGQ